MSDDSFKIAPGSKGGFRVEWGDLDEDGSRNKKDAKRVNSQKEALAIAAAKRDFFDYVDVTKGAR